MCLVAMLWAAPARAADSVVISEFVASNKDGLLDEDGDRPDWVELYNAGAAGVNLDGWFLTDSATNLTKWRFPATNIPAGGCLVVFASAKGRAVAGAPLHANFQLDGDGEFLALVGPDGVGIASQFAPVFPAQKADISFGRRVEELTLITAGSAARVLVPAGPVSPDWRGGAAFDDSAWTTAPVGIGYPFTRPPAVTNTAMPPEISPPVTNRVAYGVPPGTIGTQSTYAGSLGMDFDVRSNIVVRRLGVFDSGSDGLSRTLTAVLWARNGSTGAALATLTFTPADPGELMGGSRFKTLASPCYLAPGSYTISASGYGAGEPNGNAGGVTPVWTNDPAPHLAYVGSARFANDGHTGFPETGDGGPANQYAAGTFVFSAAPAQVAYTVAAGTVGNQNFSGSLGMDFVVLSNLTVTRLGVFDSGANGLSSTLTAELWSRNENGTPGNFTDDTAGTRLAQLAFTAADPGALSGGSRLKRLATALLLAPGAYTMSAYGYSATEPNGNGVAGRNTATDNRVAFVGNGRFGSAGAYPSTPDGGAANQYAAGTFEFLSEGGTPVSQMFTGVVNASFETPAFGDEGFADGTVIGWDQSGAIAGTYNPSDASWPGATDQTPDLNTTIPEGRNVAYLTGVGHIGQTLGLSLAPYTRYTLRAWIGQRFQFGLANYSLRILGGTEVLASLSGQSAGLGSWTSNTLEFSTGPSSPAFGQPLRIELANHSALQMSFDKVQFTLAPDTNSIVTTIGTALANGSFETPALGDDGFVNNLVSGWERVGTTFAGTFNPNDARYSGATDQAPDDDTTIPHGRNIAFVNGPGTLAQSLADTLLPGFTYQLTASAGQRDDIGTPVTYAIRLLAGGVEIGSAAGVTPGADSWTRRVVTVPVPASHPQAGQSLRVELVNSGAAQAGFDDVRLVASTDIRFNAGPAMSNVNASAFVRLPFVLSNAAEVARLTLRMRHDDGFAAWLNGFEVARMNAPAALAHNSAATVARTGNEGATFDEWDLGAFTGALRNGTNILAVQGLNFTADDSDFFLLPELTATRVGAAPLYFTTPSPGSATPPGSPGWLGLVGDTHTSTNRGYYDAPIEVALSCSTLDAVIRFTLDSSLPGETNGFSYTAPVVISNTTILRLIALKPGWRPSDVDTHSYLFIRDAMAQSNSPALPATWGGFPADYAMDRRIVTNAMWGASLSNDLRSLPILSLVLDPNDLFRGNGIYANPTLTGLASERGCSAEYFFPDGTRSGFSVNCGIRVQGDASRSHTESAKKSFRLAFRKQWGPGSLDYPLFDGNPVTKFQTVRLKAYFGDGWTVPREHPKDSSFVRDQWARDTHRAMGQPAADGTHALVYLNGLYWGVYCMIERPDADYQVAHFGGAEEDWDVLSSGEIADGSAAAWTAMFAAAEAGLAGNTAYTNFIATHLDVDNFIDWMMLNQHAYNQDWFGGAKNYYAARSRLPGGKWRFFSWDAEHILSIIGIARAVDTDFMEDFNSGGLPARLYHLLRANAEFRLRFADRVQRHCFNGGALTRERSEARWTNIAGVVFAPIVPESARWGDSFPAYTSPILPSPPWPQPLWTPPLTRSNVVEEQTRLFTQVFPTRTAVYVQQCRTAGLFPLVDAPVFTQHGGPVGNGFSLYLTNVNLGGVVYFTTDGSDPRAFGGAVLSGAQMGGGPLVLTAPTFVRARVLSAGTWSALAEAQFYTPQNFSALQLSEIYYNPPGATDVDGDEFEFVEFRNVGANALDLGGLAFTAGIGFTFTNGTVLAPGAYFVLARNAAVFASRFPAAPVNGLYSGKLDNAGETLTLTHPTAGPVMLLRYNDRSPWPLAADGGGPSLQRMNTNAEHNLPQNWAAAPPTPGAAPPSEIVDTDGDGMPDVWETLHGFNLLQRDGTADADGDGASNALEFQVGTDPRVAQDFYRLTATIGMDGIELGVHQLPDLDYLIEQRPDISTGPWITSTNLGRRNSALPVRVTLPPTNSSQFYRLRVGTPVGP